MHRFFVSPELVKITSIEVPLPKDLAHQIRDVIRLDIGEQLLLLDNSGDEVLATVARINKASVEVYLLERRPGKRESAVRIILCQGMLKSTRFEWILEKGTELGVSVFSPIICRRSIAGLEGTGSSKIQRWQRIIQEAAEQSGRSRLPELLPIRSLVDALSDILQDTLAIMPWEEEHSLTLHDALNSTNRFYRKCRGDPCGRPIVPIAQHNRPVYPNASYNRPLHRPRRWLDGRGSCSCSKTWCADCYPWRLVSYEQRLRQSQQ